MKFSSMILLLLGGSRVATAFTTRSRTLIGAHTVARQLSATVESDTTNEAAEIASSIPDMEEIVSLCKRRGIIFPSSDIYNGYAGFFDYGPLGAELKKNIKDQWWKTFVTQREDVVGIDSSIIHNPTTWQSSGMFFG
jgi:hypothetical protein